MAGQILRLPIADRQRPSIPGASHGPDHHRFRDADAEWLWSATTCQRRAFYSMPAIRSAILGGLKRECLHHLLGNMAAVYRELAVLVRDTGHGDRLGSRSLRGVARGIAQDLARLEADLAVVGSAGATSPVSAAMSETTALLLTTFRQTAETVGAAGLCPALSVCRATLCILSRRLAMATQIRWKSCDPEGLRYWLALEDDSRATKSAATQQEAPLDATAACPRRQATLAQTKLIYAVMGLAFSHALVFEDLESEPLRPSAETRSKT
jgi:hypothetical protein